jgi:hypothetical protein
MSLLTRLSFATLLLPFHAAIAAPRLDELWPSANGTRWTFRVENVELTSPEQNFVSEGFMEFSGETMTPGGLAQVLLASHSSTPAKVSSDASALPAMSPILAQVWRARPDLRPALAARGLQLAEAPVWYPLLLHGGYFMKGALNIQMWNSEYPHPTWTYLTNDLASGAEFTQQLIPELADNVILHGTVEATDVDIETEAGTFHHAVRMGYRVDYGLSPLLDPSGDELGLVRSETRGHVHFVPGVGPVELLEEFVPIVEWQCDGTICPPDDIKEQTGQVAVTLRLSLISSTVAVQEQTWSAVKSLFRN